MQNIIILQGNCGFENITHTHTKYPYFKCGKLLVKMRLGNGHKVTARVGGVIWDGPWEIFGQFRWAANVLVYPRLGANKNPCMSTSKNKDINNKSIQNYPNYQMQMMLLKPVLCLYNNKKWSNHGKYSQMESSSVS